MIDFEALKNAKYVKLPEQLRNGEQIPIEKIKHIQLRNGNVIDLPDDNYIKTVVISTVVETARSYADFEFIIGE